ncbi:hypothetical protein, partial [Salmonella sp. s51228]|uniref:hypothetical protein n=1 Tax=Salmonella sp. s51228 TaxID=3159652 RepID=UPI0039802309
LNIYFLKKNKKSTQKETPIDHSATNPDTYVYNYIGVNALDVSTSAQPIYCEMAAIPTASINESKYVDTTTTDFTNPTFANLT